MTTASKSTVEAVTAPKVKTTVGAVVSLGVKTPGGKRPTFNAPGQQAPVYCEKTGADTYVASWIPATAGVHDVTVSLADADSATFSVTATSEES